MTREEEMHTLQMAEKQLEYVSLQLESAIQHLRETITVLQNLRRSGAADFDYRTGMPPSGG